ncbi:MAG: membrane dipeptidase [Thermoleophilaceae bacterium]
MGVPLAVVAALPSGADAQAPKLANGCVVIGAGRRFVVAGGSAYRAPRVPRGRALPIYLKPTGLGTYLLFDRQAHLLTVVGDGSVAAGSVPGPAAQWAIRGAKRGRFTVVSTSARRALSIDPKNGAVGTGRATRLAFTRARGCRAYPEAVLGVTGRARRSKRRDGTIFGFADAHVHMTADFRGGGQVIAGESFDPFGITQALGRDADVHGPDGSLDVTGNLLRSGSPVGTHDTHGWPTFAGWPKYDTYTHQQIYYRWLQRAWMSGLRFAVAQTVEDEPLCNVEPRRSHSCDETQSVELQIGHLRAMQDYVDAQSGGRGRGWFRLVYSPQQARRVMEQGKLAVVIGIEWSDPFGCSESMGQPHCTRADIDAGIAHLRRIGVRALFIAHWVDNALAGAALEGGDVGAFIGAMQIEETGTPFATGACPDPSQGVEQPPLPGRMCNSRGLTDLGEYAVGKLMDNHMLIEADHLSESARERVLAIAEARRYPLVSSHTGTGGLWTPLDLKRLYALGGIASATIDDAPALRDKVLSYRGYRVPGQVFGVPVGTDTGGFNALPGPTQGQKVSFRYPFRAYHCDLVFGRQQTGQKTFDITKDGVAHYGLLPDLLADVERQPGGRAALGMMFHSAEAYVQTWQRVARA